MSDYTPPTLVIPTPGGNAGDGSLKGTLTVQANAAPTSNQTYLMVTSSKRTIIYTDGATGLLFDGSGFSYLRLATVAIKIDKSISSYNGVGTSGLGVPPLYGDDARTGLTAVDASAKTLYTTNAAGQLYRLMGRILATAGTSPSATYTIKWTEGGATITKTLTISALDADSDLSILIQPDNGTAITAQLTAISGTGTTVNVAATVEQMA